MMSQEASKATGFLKKLDLILFFPLALLAWAVKTVWLRSDAFSGTALTGAWSLLDTAVGGAALFFSVSLRKRGVPGWIALAVFLSILFHPYTFRPGILLGNEMLSVTLALAGFALSLQGEFFLKSAARYWAFATLWGMISSYFFCFSRYPLLGGIFLLRGIWLIYAGQDKRLSAPLLLAPMLALGAAGAVYLQSGSLPYPGSSTRDTAARVLTPSSNPRLRIGPVHLWANALVEAAAKAAGPDHAASFSKVEVEVSGWAFGRNSPVVAVSLKNHRGELLASTRSLLPKPEVRTLLQKKYPEPVPERLGFLIKEGVPYYRAKGLALEVTDASGRKFESMLQRELPAFEGLEWTHEKRIHPIPTATANSRRSKTESHLAAIHTWLSTRLFFFFLAATLYLACSKTARSHLDSVSSTFFILAAALALGFLQILTTFLPGDFLVRTQDIFLVSLLYPALAVLAIYLAFLRLSRDLLLPEPFPTSPAQFFARTAAIFGILLVFAMPPFQAADEGAHFYRAYQISEWNLRTPKVPRSLSETFERFDYLAFLPDNKIGISQILPALHVPLEPEKTWGAPVLSYSPVPYLPAALGILSGRWFGASPLALMYLGRLFSLLAYLGLVSLALRLTPLQKWAFCLLALAPMSMAQASAVTADTVTIGLSFLTFAYLLKLSQSDAVLQAREWLLLSSLLALLALTKPVYAILALLFLLIPKRNVGSWPVYWLGFVWLLLLCYGVSQGWAYFGGKVQGFQLLSPAAQEQVVFVLRHPLEFIAILMRTFYRNAGHYWDHLVGRLGWLDTGLPYSFRIFYTALTIACAWLGWNGRADLGLWKRAWLFLVLFAGVALIATVLFITWTTPGSAAIEGIQGRYFLPFVPILLLLLYPSKNPIAPRSGFPPFQLAAIAASLCVATTLFSVLTRYYGAF